MTFARRQIACGMRHCCARRIVETGGRRELLRTSTRWVERHPQGVCRIRKAAEPPTAAQQRMIGAEASRIATSTRQRRAQTFPFRRHKGRSSPRLPILTPFFWTVTPPVFFLGKENGGCDGQQRIALHSSAARSAATRQLPVRCETPCH